MHEIQEGDIVVIVRWPCCGQWLGMVMTVQQFNLDLPDNEICECGGCGATHPWMFTFYNEMKGIVPLSWVRKLKPLTSEEKREFMVSLLKDSIEHDRKNIHQS